MQTATQPDFFAPAYRAFAGWGGVDWVLYLALVVLYGGVLLVGGVAPHLVQQLPTFAVPCFVVMGALLAFTPWVLSRPVGNAPSEEQAADQKLLALHHTLVLLRPCPSYHFVEEVLIQLSRPVNDLWASPSSLWSSPAFPVKVWVRDNDDFLMGYYEFTTGAVRLGLDWGPGFYTLQVIHPEFERTLNVLKTGPAVNISSMQHSPWGPLGTDAEPETGASLVCEAATQSAAIASN